MESLIDWHLAVGDEVSVTAALAFLETEYLRDIPLPGAFPAALATAQRAARHDLAGLTALLEAHPVDWDAAQRRLTASAPIRRLRALVTAQQNYMFLAQQYLRAADLYRSRALYEKARLYFAPALAGFRLLYGDRAAMADALSQTESWLGLWNHHINRMHALEARLAITQAEFTHAAADIAAAEAMLTRQADPVLALGVERAAEGKEPCDDVGDEPRLAPLARACDQENSFATRLLDFSVARARLDLLTANARDVRSFDQALILLDLERGRSTGWIWPRFRAVDEAEVALRLAHADLLDRLAGVRAAEATMESGQAAYDVSVLRSLALAELARAAEIARPGQVPTRFRRIAARFLEIAAHLPRGDRADPVAAREAAYFRTVPANLDQIALGEP